MQPARTATSAWRGCCWTTDAEVGPGDKDGRTPVHRRRATSTARLLLDKAADVNKVDENGQATSTRRGCCWTKARRSIGRTRTVGRRCTPPAGRATSTRRCCWTKSAEVDRALENGVTPLFAACANGHVDAARLLLDKDAEVDRADKDGWNAAVHRLPERPR